MATFKVGDKVESIGPVGSKRVTGAIGTIVGIDGSCMPYLVKFDQDIGSRGVCAEQGGWWCYKDSIALVKENNMFTKKDLKSGDLVKRRDGEVLVVCVESNLLIHPALGGYKLSNIKEDLTNIYNHNNDIVAVRRCGDNPECWGFNAFGRQRGTLVYERKEVEEMTLDEVCKALGKEIKIVKER